MTIKEIFNKAKNNFLYRTLWTSAISLAVTLGFVAYNVYLGVKFTDAFAIGISIYYFLLILVRAATLIVEKRLSQKDERAKTNVRIRNYKIFSVFIFVIDVCLIAPIILMVTQPKDVNFGIIPAIAVATFSTYKVTLAIINYIRSKKLQNPTVALLREINIIDAIVSVLTLQHTLIMVNGGMVDDMRTLSFVTSIVLIVLMAVFSILSFRRNQQVFNGMLKNEQ